MFKLALFMALVAFVAAKTEDLKTENSYGLGYARAYNYGYPEYLGYDGIYGPYSRGLHARSAWNGADPYGWNSGVYDPYYNPAIVDPFLGHRFW